MRVPFFVEEINLHLFDGRAEVWAFLDSFSWFQLENERKLEALNLSLCDLHNWRDVVQWSRAQCPNMQCLDLSAVGTIDCSIIEMCLKLKDDKVISFLWFYRNFIKLLAFFFSLKKEPVIDSSVCIRRS